MLAAYSLTPQVVDFMRIEFRKSSNPTLRPHRLRIKRSRIFLRFARFAGDIYSFTAMEARPIAGIEPIQRRRE